ncbi:MAG: dephospho-CoA kinase [Rhodospirillales bacterium]|nr:dephospho-CoA kinase [Rhodospirillales bacterium]
MLILGLTGSIAMGKSTAAAMFRRLGVPVYDADAAVHRLLARGGAAVGAVDRAFPGVVADGAVDRPKLGARVFGDATALRRLEGILHPLVAEERRRFLRAAARQGRALVVLDIPLLFETAGERWCDVVCVVSAPRFLQVARLLRRPNMDRARIAAVACRQMPDAQKRRRADFVVPSGLGRAVTFAALRRIVAELREEPGKVWRNFNKLRH